MRCLTAALVIVLAAPLAQADPTDPVALRIMVRTEATRQGLPPEIADAVATVESGYQAGAIGAVGEIGLMQVLPSTARMLGFTGTNQELASPDTNIRYGVDYLHTAWQLAGEDLCTTVMKYRAGHGESRFSHKSVDYCRRVRTVLADQGYPIRGELPIATFGNPAPVIASGSGGKRRTKSTINWTAYDRRIKAIQSRVTDSSLTIMR